MVVHWLLLFGCVDGTAVDYGEDILTGEALSGGGWFRLAGEAGVSTTGLRVFIWQNLMGDAFYVCNDRMPSRLTLRRS